MKTDVEVRQDIFAFVKASAIKEAIGGELRYIPRAKGSKAEDCIISVLESDNAQIQDCIVNVNVYVPNITSGGESVENIPRTQTLAKICETTLNVGSGVGFRFYLEKQRIIAVNGKDEYVINNRIRYKFNNE
jgi:hypothetical protein